jgi:hypothetical protein
MKLVIFMLLLTANSVGFAPAQLRITTTAKGDWKCLLRGEMKQVATTPLTTTKLKGHFGNEIAVIVFAGEGGRVVPNFKLPIRHEGRRRPVRFLFEVPADPNEWLECVKEFKPLPSLRWEANNALLEISPQHLRQQGVLGGWIELSSWRWVPRMSSSVLPFKALSRVASKPQGLATLPLSTPEDKALLSLWQQWFLETLRPQAKQKVGTKERFFLSALQDGKVVVHHAVICKVLVEVVGELADDANLTAVRKQLQSALSKLSPVPLLPSAEDEIRQRIRNGTLKVSDTKEIAKITRRYREMGSQRDAKLTEALQRQAKKIGLASLKARVASQCVLLEPQKIERQLRPLMLTLRVRLQGKARCAYHQQEHVIPLSGKVRFKPLKPSPDSTLLPADKKLHWEGIPDEPVEIVIPRENAIEVRLPIAWFVCQVSGGVQVDVPIEGWQAPKIRLLFGYELFHLKDPLPLVIHLTPNRAEIAVFLLEVPFKAKLKHASIMVQDAGGKIITSQTAQWLEEFGNYGIAIKNLPYGSYRVTAKGSFTTNSTERTFSVAQTSHVSDYHAVLKLRVGSSQ